MNAQNCSEPPARCACVVARPWAVSDSYNTSYDDDDDEDDDDDDLELGGE